MSFDSDDSGSFSSPEKVWCVETGKRSSFGEGSGRI